MSSPVAPFSTDFGRLVQGAPEAVLRPSGVAELQAIIRRAAEDGRPLTSRGQGFSQGGQSVAARGRALDLSALAEVDAPDLGRMTVSCQGGASWRAVLERCLGSRVIPRVMPLNLDLTVGGVLSVGGIGATSHLHGPAVSTVAGLQVITGAAETAELRRPGESRAADRAEPTEALWGAVLGGLGRCAVITRAELEVRPFAPELRTFYLLYDSLDGWLEDQQRLLSRPHPPEWMEGFTCVASQGLRNTPAGRRPFGVWFYGLHLSYEHGPGGRLTDAPDTDLALAGLSPYRLVHVEDSETAAFPHRYEPRFQAMRALGGWDQPHPWVEAFLSLGDARRTLPDLLAELPLSLGDGHRLMFVADRQLPASLSVPEGRPLVAFAILPPGLPPALRQPHLQALRMAHDRLVAGGGKRYLSGWLQMMDEAGWRRHFGVGHEAWVEAKRRFDPRGVFASALFDGPADAEEDRPWTR